MPADIPRVWPAAAIMPTLLFALPPRAALAGQAASADRTCLADCSGDGELDFFDFLCFQDLFSAGDLRADCDGSGALDIFDFLCFQNAFAAGCPALEIIDLGTEAPPPMICGAPMTPFPEDPRLLFDPVTNVPSPLGGAIEFGRPVNHRRIGIGWATWSHGYLGDVYYTDWAQVLDIALPGNSVFSLYIAPNAFQLVAFDITAFAAGAEVSLEEQHIEGDHGARGFAICGGAESVRVEITFKFFDVDFAVGEFGIAD